MHHVTFWHSFKVSERHTALMMEAVCSSEMLVYSKHSTWCNNTGDHHMYSNLKLHDVCFPSNNSVHVQCTLDYLGEDYSVSGLSMLDSFFNLQSI
jgi:hypothetical protein